MGWYFLNNIIEVALLLVFYLAVEGACQETCQVNIQNGTILGYQTETINGKGICSYTGIPYAKPPVGPLRFKNPEPAESWKDSPLNATLLPNWCPQTVPSQTSVMSDEKYFNPNQIEIVESEDCLYLNVFTPLTQNNPLKTADGYPVLIWIHGGNYISGSALAATPGRLLAIGDVILVTIHYRLGILGFFSTGDSSSPGNYGLKDQSQAIRWVHENIANFGGNPNQVTVFGNSAGGYSTILQMLSPANKGLIHGIIAQSGAFSTLQENPLKSATYFAERFDCPTNLTEMVDCIRQLKWETIITEQAQLNKECYLNISCEYSSMKPVVEIESPDAFITQDPIEIMKSGDVPDIPVILGGNKHDGSYMLGILYLFKIGPGGLDKSSEYVKHELLQDVMHNYKIHENVNIVAREGIESSLEFSYLSGVNRSSWNDSIPGVVDIASVFGFKSGIQLVADLLSKRNPRVFVYSFEHHSENTMWSALFGSNAHLIPIPHGITHGDELMYLFDLPLPFSPEDEQFSNLMCQVWVDFAQFNETRIEHWVPYERMEEFYLKFNVTPTSLKGYRNSWRPNGFQWN